MSRLLIHESPLQVLPSLAVKIGLNEAIVLQQLHYWLNPDHNKNIHEDVHWVYNSYEQWQKQFPFWSKETIKRAIHSLEKMTLILSCKFNEDKFDHRKWYSINYEALQQLECKNNRSGQIDTADQVIMHDRSGHFDPIGEVKLTSSDGSTCSDHYKEQRLPSETTTEIHSARACMAPQMLKIWNQTFTATSPVQLTSFRKTKLSLILFSHFGNDLVNWQKFCHSIQSSSFLQGKGPRGWRATLDWCVEEVNLCKILEGNYQDSDSDLVRSPSLDESLNRAQSHIKTLIDPQHQQLALSICAQLGPNTYVSWFQEMGLAYQDGTRIELSFPTQFIRDYVETNYFHTLDQLVQPLYPGPQQLKLTVQKVVLSSGPQSIPQETLTSTDTAQKPVLKMVKELTQQESQPQRMSAEKDNFSSLSKIERPSS